jgi:hypothetical protein
MKLNAQLIYEELSKRYNVMLSGPADPEPLLERPRFYMEGDEDFEENGLYLATAEHLPKRPRIRRNAVLVCIGDSLVLSYYRERLTLLQIRERADFFKVFNALQDIFGKYERWENRLMQDVLEAADISRLISDSADIIPFPFYVIDSAFRFLGSSTSALESEWVQAGSGSLNPESFSKYLSASELQTERRNAFVLKLFDKPVLCVNLFDRAGRYQGCLCIDLKDSEPSQALSMLAEKLAGLINTAMERNPRFLGEGQISIKSVMQSLMEEQPLGRAQRAILRTSNNSTPYLCICMRGSRGQQLPMSYICDVFEESFKDSSAFVFEDSIAAFLNSSEKDSDQRRKLYRSIKDFCGSLKLCAGVSTEFTELFNIRMHYLQARSALEDGLLLNPEDTVFYFSSYALTEMVINSLGGLPAEAYYPEGLKAIFEHDRKSPVSYLETMRVLLEENLSYTAAAQRLFIHRSTLLDRIERIEKEMNVDLNDPEQRLQLEILLKALDLEEVMKSFPGR